MSSFVIRTEELTEDEISQFYVADREDDEIFSKLLSPSPVLLVGSRGVGKTFLFRVSENRLKTTFSEDRILPVFITFRKASLIKSSNPLSFQTWMVGKIAAAIFRTLKKVGLLSDLNEYEPVSRIETIVDNFENSYKNPDLKIDAGEIPSIDNLIEAVEDACTALNIRRIVVYIDEAAHVFYPEQQREFFTLFRDLRSPYIKCNAAIYPGVTVFGDTFEPAHDAVVIHLTRSIMDEDYVENMKQMVLRQVDSREASKFAHQGELLKILIYACSGNPRNLLRSIDESGKFNSNDVNNMFRNFYRNGLFAEHTKLCDKYPGYGPFIDWGRDYIEKTVMSALKKINDEHVEKEGDSRTTAFFWVHKDAPQQVKEAIRILEYSGIVYEMSSGIRATRSEIGTRYMVNLGCLLAQEAIPTKAAAEIINNLDVRRMAEYGQNSKVFSEIQSLKIDDENETLHFQLEKPIDALAITDHQKRELHALNIDTIGQLLQTDEVALKSISYVGNVRARQIKNSCVAAVYEYLLG